MLIELVNIHFLSIVQLKTPFVLPLQLCNILKLYRYSAVIFSKNDIWTLLIHIQHMKAFARQTEIDKNANQCKFTFYRVLQKELWWNAFVKWDLHHMYLKGLAWYMRIFDTSNKIQRTFLVCDNAFLTK